MSSKISELKNILERLKDAKRAWKTELVVFWVFALRYLEPKYILRGLQNTKFQHYLPAFYKCFMKSTAKEMHTFCTTRDDPLSYFHLIYAFSLFEELVRIASKPTRVNSTKWRFVKPLLKKWKIKVRDIRELTLARETRNCFVHHNGNSDWQPWWEAYNDARRKNPPIKYGDSVRNAFPGGRKNKNGQRMNRLLENINKWYNIIIKISIQIIKEEVKKIPIKIIQ